MMKFIGQRLQVKLFLVIILTLLIPTALIVVYSVNITTGELLRTAESRNLQLVRSQAAAARELLAEGERDVLFLSQASATRRFVGVLDGIGDETTAKGFLSSRLRLFLHDNPVYLSAHILDNTGQELLVVDRRSGVPASVDAAYLENHGAHLYFIEPLRLGGQVYISDIELDAANGTAAQPYVPALRFSLPLFAEGGGIVGVIVLKAHALPYLQVNAVSDARATSYVIDRAGNYLFHPDEDKLYGSLLGTDSSFINDQPNNAATIRQQREGSLFDSPDRPATLQAYTTTTIPGRDDTYWTFIYEESLDNVLGEIYQARLVTITVAAVALLVALVVAWAITHNIVQPVQQLAQVSKAISQQQWDVTIPQVRGQDEIGRLAQAFDKMSRELKALYSSMEMRVIARTSELETVAKVSAAVAAVLDTDQLLATVSELTRTNFNLSCICIYLLDESGNNLIMVNDASGDLSCRSVPLDAEDSLVAWAGRCGEGIIANDIHKTLAATGDIIRSEMALPLRFGGKLLGVLKLQSDKRGRFTESDLRVMSILSAQLAVAVRNADLYHRQIETARQLALAQERAEQASRAKSLFLSNMSHELRTPLNVIIGYATSMLEKPSMYSHVPLPDVYAKDIGLIRDNGYHLIGLINDILDLSKIEAGKQELQFAAINLTDIFKGVLTTSVGLIKDKPVQLKADYPPNLPPVWADAQRVRQIVLNLMSNAIKFTDQGSVTLRAVVEAAFVKVSVIDTGIGIARHMQAYIFDRFNQVSETSGTLHGGTGLGLDISKQLCQMQGGDLTFESVYGEGSTFTFTLPLANEWQQTVTPNTSTAFSTSRVFAGRPVVTAAGTVLLAADNLRLVSQLQQRLEQDGYIVLSTSSAGEVLELAQIGLPNAIFLQLQLPAAELQALIHAVKADPDTGHIPIILGVAETVSHAFESVDFYLQTPLDEQYFCDMVKLACAQAPVKDSQTL